VVFFQDRRLSNRVVVFFEMCSGNMVIFASDMILYNRAMIFNNMVSPSTGKSQERDRKE
jgi:hypothetical protein